MPVYAPLSRFRGAFVTRNLTDGSSAQGISSGTQVGLTFDQVIYDTDGFFNLGADNAFFTAPYDGIYLVGASVEWEYNPTGFRMLVCSIRLDGWSIMDVRPSTTTSTWTTNQSVSGLMHLTKGKQVHASVWQDSGSTRQILVDGTVYDGSKQSPAFWVAYLGQL